jgi:hypothetical protein
MYVCVLVYCLFQIIHSLLYETLEEWYVFAGPCFYDVSMS